jgi:hypothetical protein
MLLFAQIAAGVVLSFLLLRYRSLIVRAGVLLLLGLVVLFVWLFFLPVIGPVRWQLVRFKEGRRVPRFEFESSGTGGDLSVSEPVTRQPHPLSAEKAVGSDPALASHWNPAQTDDTDDGFYRKHG